MTGEMGPLLRPISALFRLGVGLHGRLYDAGLLRSRGLAEPVISLGNLTVGGTGKTPATIWLAGQLRERGLRPMILTRGYGRRARGVLVLAPGEPWPGPAEAGDEPLEMAQALGDVPVVVARDRHAAALYARDAFRPDVFLLDDGFQHRPLRRDVDIVLLDAARPFGNGHCLPAGPLREPPDALSRADIVVLTRAASAGLSDAGSESVTRRLRPGVPLFLADHEFMGLEPLAGFAAAGAGASREAWARELPGARAEVVATAGVAAPQEFCTTLVAAGFQVARLVPFPDHQPFSAVDVRDLESAAGGRPIVTTAKDATRWLAAMSAPRAGWWVARVRFSPRRGEALLEAILERMSRGTARKKGAEA